MDRNIRFIFIIAWTLLGMSGLLIAGCGSSETGADTKTAYQSKRNSCPSGKTPDRTVTLTERAWKYFPDKIKVNRGDLVKITMKTTDNGIGAGHGFAIEGFEQKVFLNGVTKNNSKSTCFEANKSPGEYTFYCATQCSTDRRHTNMNGTLVIKPEGEKIEKTASSAESKQRKKWEQVELPRPIPESSDELIKKGKTLYNGKLACFSCHGKSGNGNGPASNNLTNTKTGESISPRNFQNPDNYKWGTSREAIARTVLTGGKNPGSPMPPMKGSIKPGELWAVATYVKSLQKEQ